MAAHMLIGLGSVCLSAVASGIFGFDESRAREMRICSCLAPPAKALMM